MCEGEKVVDHYLLAPIEIPVRVDVDKLLSRTAHFNNEMEQIQFINKWLIAEQEEKSRIYYKRFSRKTFFEWFGNELKAYSSPNQLGALKLLIYYLNIAADLNGLLNIVLKFEKDRNFLIRK